jgi:MarR family transcriptional regulator, 2-MHQ and catechol-resistance regulon repressor
VTRLVDSLVEEGIVERVTHPEDKRKTWAVMTDEGIDIFEAEMPPMAEQIERLWKGLQPEEKRLMVHLLSKLRLSLLTVPPDEVRGMTPDAP